MGKCFDAIKRIKFGDGRKAHEILGFIDPSGEVRLPCFKVFVGPYFLYGPSIHHYKLNYCVILLQADLFIRSSYAPYVPYLVPCVSYHCLGCEFDGECEGARTRGRLVVGLREGNEDDALQPV